MGMAPPGLLRLPLLGAARDRMKLHKTLAVSLALVGFTTVLIPSAAAEPLVCVDDLCLDPAIDAFGQDSACHSSTTTRTGTWYYMLGTVRDLPIAGAYYTAAWTYTTIKGRDAGGACVTQASSCKVDVSDGSHFQYLRIGTATAANGEYKGLPTQGGTLTCGATTARLHTFVGLVLTLDGYGSKL